MRPDNFKPSHWLEWFTMADHRWMPTPFELEIAGRKHSIATDSKILVGIEAGGLFPPFGGKPKVADEIREYFTRHLDLWEYAATEDLKKVCGNPEYTIKTVSCPACHGKKEIKHNCGCEFCECKYEPCEDCDENGQCEEIIISDPVYRTIRDKVFDVNYLAWLMKYAPVEDEIELTTDKEQLFIQRGNSLFSVMMSCSPPFKMDSIPPLILG